MTVRIEKQEWADEEGAYVYGESVGVDSHSTAGDREQEQGQSEWAARGAAAAAAYAGGDSYDVREGGGG